MLRSPFGIAATLGARALPRFAAAALALSIAMKAQTPVVVPAAFASVEAPESQVLVTNQVERMQIVIDASQLGITAPTTLTELWLRRDRGLAETFAPAPMSLTLHLGHASRAAADALPDFSANVQGRQKVFRGAVTAPLAPWSATPGWTADETVRITFTTPFAYAGGGLVVEIESTPLGSPWWPVDAVGEASTGDAVEVGQACGPFASWPASSFVATEGLVLGRTARFSMRGQPDSLALLLLSNAVLATPIDLTFAGAPGCDLWLLPFASLSTVTQSLEPVAGMGAAAWRDLHLPRDPALAGGSLAAQWLELGSSAPVATNALQCTLAACASEIGIARIQTPMGANPRVSANAIPVLGFITQ